MNGQKGRPQVEVRCLLLHVDLTFCILARKSQEKVREFEK